jgi:hypothetical protein
MRSVGVLLALVVFGGTPSLVLAQGGGLTGALNQLEVNRALQQTQTRIETLRREQDLQRQLDQNQLRGQQLQDQQRAPQTCTSVGLTTFCQNAP